MPADRVLLLLSLAGLPACSGDASDATTRPAPKLAGLGPVERGPLELVFTYGSEKEKWIEAATGRFHASGPRTASGRPIEVTAVPMGSGDCIDEILQGTRQAHLTSPASAAFIALGNAKARARTGKDLIASTERLVLSPVVLAIWKPMAEAMGYGARPIGWSDVLQLAKADGGWATLGHPEWGSFKLGHTHPEFSNSGLVSLMAIAHASTGTGHGLTASDVQDPELGDSLGAIESAIVHYGSSTGFFGRTMFQHGPSYLSAAVLYENMVIESQTGAEKPRLPVVAVYPKEGTFWGDHPVGIVEAAWVSPEHRDAAARYIAFLRARPQQQLALAYGFRPTDPTVVLDDSFSAANGVDAKEPRRVLDQPSVEVTQGLLRLWKTKKKHADVVLAVDVSGSMRQEERLAHAKAGALALLQLLGAEDRLTILPFSNVVARAATVAVGSGRSDLQRQIESLVAEGGTALYDATLAGYDLLADGVASNRIAAVVVLTDGVDTDSKASLETLLDRLSPDGAKAPIRVFTIGYGGSARDDVLQSIADCTQARYYKGTPQNIRAVFKDIATHF